MVLFYSASVPGTDLTKADLIQSLLRNVKAAQARCVGRWAGKSEERRGEREVKSYVSPFCRIQQGPSASLLSQLLKVNDVLLDAIQYYEGSCSALGSVQQQGSNVSCCFVCVCVFARTSFR